MNLITAREAFERLCEKKSESLLNELPKAIEAALVNEEDFFTLKNLPQSVRNVLEEKGYKITENEKGFCVSFDLSKPCSSVYMSEKILLDSLMIRQFLQVPELKISSIKKVGSCFSNSVSDGVYILTSNHLCVRPEAWFNYSHQSPIGIAVIEGNKKRIVALKSSPEPLKLLTSSKNATSKQYDTFDKAKEDWNGKENTLQLVVAGSPAAKYCNEYSCGHIPAGSWYLSSLGEKIFLQKHKDMINAALTICGGEPLFYGYHKTSTEYSPSCAWVLRWFGGDTDYNHKGNGSQVRPISAFLS